MFLKVVPLWAVFFPYFLLFFNFRVQNYEFLAISAHIFLVHFISPFSPFAVLWQKRIKITQFKVCLALASLEIKEKLGIDNNLGWFVFGKETNLNNMNNSRFTCFFYACGGFRKTIKNKRKQKNIWIGILQSNNMNNFFLVFWLRWAKGSCILLFFWGPRSGK